MNILVQTQLCDKTSEGFLSLDLFCTFECQLNFEEFYEYRFFLFPGNPDDSHHSFYASRALWDGPYRAGAVQQDPVQDSAWRQQQLP